MALQAGVPEPITFEPDLVPPPPITTGLLIPPLEQRLAQFPGVTSILVKDLDTGEVVYESNFDYVLSGMSIVKIGIMVEVYRHFGGRLTTRLTWNCSTCWAANRATPVPTGCWPL